MTTKLVCFPIATAPGPLSSQSSHPSGSRPIWPWQAAAAGCVAIVYAAVRILRRRRMMQRNERAALKDLWREVNGCRLYARCSMLSHPSAEGPIVLVHGWGVSSSYFIPTAERLAPWTRVYAPDLPGHGRSDTPRQPLDIERLAQALIDWMDAAGLRQATLIGNSMGCQIAVEAALRDPPRIERLVLIGPTVDPVARSAARQCWRLIMSSVHERPSLVWHLVKDYLQMNVRLLPEFRSMLHHPIEMRLSLVQTPTLLVRGRHDHIVPQRWFEEAARLMHTAQTAVVGGGHAVHYSRPEELLRTVKPFLMEKGDDSEQPGCGPSSGGTIPCSQDRVRGRR